MVDNRIEQGVQLPNTAGLFCHEIFSLFGNLSEPYSGSRNAEVPALISHDNLEKKKDLMRSTQTTGFSAMF